MYKPKQVRQMLKNYHEEYMGQHYISGIDYSKDHVKNGLSNNPNLTLCKKIDLDRAMLVLPSELFTFIKLYYILGEDIEVICRKYVISERSFYYKIEEAINIITKKLNEMEKDEKMAKKT